PPSLTPPPRRLLPGGDERPPSGLRTIGALDSRHPRPPTHSIRTPPAVPAAGQEGDLLPDAVDGRRPDPGVTHTLLQACRRSLSGCPEELKPRFLHASGSARAPRRRRGPPPGRRRGRAPAQARTSSPGRSFLSPAGRRAGRR